MGTRPLCSNSKHPRSPRFTPRPTPATPRLLPLTPVVIMDAVLPLPANHDASSCPKTGLDPANSTPTPQPNCHHADAIRNWPLCQSCLPLIHALFGAGLGQWSLPSPFPDYVYVPALVHRSQLGTRGSIVPGLREDELTICLLAFSAAPNIDSGTGPAPSVPNLTIPEPTELPKSPSTPSPKGSQRKGRGVKIAVCCPRVPPTEFLR